MKRNAWKELALGAAGVLLLAGCGAPVQGGSNLVGGEDVFTFTRENFPRIDGSTSTVPLAQAICSVLLDESREDVADLTQFSKTTASYAALIYGEKDLLIAAEPAQSVLEIKASQGFAWSMEPFAIEGLVFVVNADNPVDSLSVEQVQKIYTGEITNWSEVGGSDGEIVVIGREAGSGTRDGFEEIVGVKDNCKYAQELTATGAVTAAVAANENAIGYASLSAVNDSVKALTVEGVACTEETVKDGSYKVQRPFNFVVKKDAELSEAAQAFVEYVTSGDANQWILEAGCVPIV